MILQILTILRRFLGSRTGMNIAGLIIICALVWVIGATFHFSIATRFIIIGIIILIVAAIILGKFLWTKNRGKNLQQNLQKQADSSASRKLEIAYLKEGMTSSIAALKTSELGIKYRGHAALYALPWFVIIGPPAAGKSTVLRNSGLSFPVTSEQNTHIKGTAGTRNCDWWFSNEAIILDTAGRYTTEESDKDEWMAFLDMVKKSRPRLPLNGIIIAINLAELTAGDAENVEWHVKVTRNRIAEIYQRMGYIFPVTLLFTQVDKVPGFLNFFDNLSPKEREQVWGINLEGDYEDQLDELYARLTQGLIPKMSIERDLTKKLEIYSFPSNFKTNFTNIKKFINLLLQTNPYQEAPQLCGAYFTSGTQEDNQDNTTFTKQSYFIKDIFEKVIFPNKYAAAKTHGKIRLQKITQSAGALLCAAVLVIAFILYSTSLTSNTMLLHKGEKVAAQLVNDHSMNSLASAYGFYNSLTNYQRTVPLHLRLGLYRGNREIEPLQQMLSYLMQDKFLQPMGKYLTNKLTQYGQQWHSANVVNREKMRGDYYTTLKAYLMLSFANHIDIDQGTTIFSLYWSKILSGDMNNAYERSVDTANYSGLVKFYLQHPNKWHAQQNLVNTARSQLYLASDARNLYAQITNITGAKLPPLSLNKLVTNNDNLLINDSMIPSIYTLKGWENYVKPEITKIAMAAYRHDWVMDTPFMKLGEQDNTAAPNDRQSWTAEKKLANKLKSLYFDDYRQTWLKFLTTTTVRRFTSLNDADKQISNLASTDGPMNQLLLAVEANANLPGLKTPLLNLNSILGNQLKSYFNEIVKVQNDTDALIANPNVNLAAQKYATQILSGSGGNTQLYQSMMAANMLSNSIDDAQTRLAIRHFLLQPIRESWRIILYTATQQVEQQWENQIVSNYHQNISNKFPFSHTSDTDAATADVTAFFQPQNGMLWTFVNTYLKPFLAYSPKGWEEQKWLGIGAGFSPEFLTALTQAKNISDTLFSNGQLGYSYQIYPEPTPGISQIILNTDGKSYHYNNGPQEWENFSWSGDSGSTAYLAAVAAHGSNPRAINLAGPWSSMHLIRQGKVTPLRDGTYKVKWKLHNSVKTYTVSALFRARGKGDIFRELLFNQFTLPSHLLKDNNAI